MRTYKMDHGKSYFEFERTDFVHANNRKSFKFNFDVKSYGFAGSLSGVWFYYEELNSFIIALNDLVEGKTKQANLNAMSDFVLIITPDDTLGHFSAKFSLLNTISENSADLTVKIETQSLVEFADELNSIINS